MELTYIPKVHNPHPPIERRVVQRLEYIELGHAELRQALAQHVLRAVQGQYEG